jgi:hypothetical protein
MDDTELTQNELDDETGDLLPDREAMSLVTPDPAIYPLPDGDLPPLVDDTGGDAGEAASGAAGSETRPESVTDADRSEHFASSDSASAQS